MEYQPPKKPQGPPSKPKLLPLPEKPELMVPVPLEPPADCYDSPQKGLVEHVFKGSQVYGREQVMPLARSLLFAGDQVRPHFTFGGVPFPVVGNSPHMLVVGTTGSGKTTTLLRLMSSLLPLSTAQAKSLSDKAAPYPDSLHQWARSRTHQAVVYNAKGEYIQYLEAFGFDTERDLFNLDPTDPNGYAWDVAADIEDQQSIERFAEQLIPINLAKDADPTAALFDGTARDVVEALILAFRNAAIRAGKKPSWTLRDLVVTATDDRAIVHVLRWHDMPVETVERIFGRASQQKSSVMMTLRERMRPYAITANCWHHAARQGRAISLKQWALKGGQSVLVLPNTRDNIAAYGPLNRSLMKALSDVVLDREYSLYVDDNGEERKRHRLFLLDEFGDAGRLDELSTLLAQGRSFGVHVVLGMHQLSQARKAYGEDDAETIVGLCPYRAFLKSDDVRTQKWMSELIGNCLRSYNKASYSFSTTNGVTNTKSVNESKGGGTTEGLSLNTQQTRGSSDTSGSSSSHTDSTNQSSTSAARKGESGTTTRGSGKSDTQATNASHTDQESTAEGVTASTNNSTNWNKGSGTSRATSKSTTEGETKTNELRGEAAIEPSEFGRFPDPETTGKCEGVYISPSLPTFRTTLQMQDVAAELEFPDRMGGPGRKRTREENDAVSRSTPLSEDDLVRLFVDKPQDVPFRRHNQALLGEPFEVEPYDPKRNEPPRLGAPNDDEPSRDEGPDDDDPPLADFEF
jgi:hypothetical protein